MRKSVMNVLKDLLQVKDVLKYYAQAKKDNFVTYV